MHGLGIANNFFSSVRTVLRSLSLSWFMAALDPTVMDAHGTDSMTAVSVDLELVSTASVADHTSSTDTESTSSAVPFFEDKVDVQVLGKR